MSHYKPYPAYKDSGVEWLGRVPEHWDVTRISNHYRLRNGFPFDSSGFSPDGEEADRLIRIRDLSPSETWIYTSEPCPEHARIEDGDVLVGMDGDFNAVLWQAGPAKLNQRVCALRGETECLTKFLLYSLPFPLRIINDTAYSTTVKHLSSVEVLGTRIALPPFCELRSIVSHLDRETARIDALVAKKTRFIELLREKRQALITHAVTKGLDPNVKMKDSGVEWLGEVPEHWDVKAIRWLSPVQRGASPRPIDDPVYFDDDGEYGWVRIEDVTASDGFLEETKQRLSELGSSLSVKLSPGALFLSIAGSVGKPCITRIKACIHDGFVYFPLLKTDPMWLVRIFESRSPFVGLGKLGTQLNLNTETVGSIKVALPPAGEISEILSDLDRCLAHLGQLISRTEHSITLLKERRSALITAAVTGQIDLREAV